jgi:hypothetical protein
MQTPQQLTDASNMAFRTGQLGLGMAQEISPQLMAESQQFGQAGANIGGQAAGMAGMGYGAGQQYAQQATSPEAMQAYMSPYMQNVVDVQQREARRAADIQREQNQAVAARQGAFGGSRQAIVEAELQRNLGTQLGDIQATGLQQAFGQAQQAQQFGAGLGLQGLQAGTQAQLAGIQGAQTGLQGVQGAISAGQYGLGALGATQGAASQLGQLGGQQFEQQMGLTDAMQKYGALQQQMQQQALDYDYQQYIAEQNLPYQQLGYFSDMIRGLPLSQSSTQIYGGQPDIASQLGGLAMAGYGMFGRKEGGQIKKYAEGGAVTGEGLNLESVGALPGRLRRLSDSQLAAYARTVKDAITLSAIQSELERRAKMRQPYEQGPEGTTAQMIAQQAEAASIGQPRVGMAGGGIVALREGGPPGVEEAQNAYNESKRALMRFPLREQVQRQDEYSQLQQQHRANEQRLRELSAPAPTPTAPQIGGLRQQVEQEIEQRRPTPFEPVPVPQAPPQAPPQGEQQGQQQLPPPPAQDRSGIMAASAPRLGSTFEEFRKMIPKGEMSPEQRTILDDMQSRISKQIDEAKGEKDTAKFDAIMLAGLAMMGGNSLADGLARAAQTGGATYMAGKKEARKALNAAENAELAFRQYELSVMKGNDKEAQGQFDSFLGYTAKMADIDAKFAAIGASGARGTAFGPDKYANTLRNIEDTVNKRFAAQTESVALLPADKKVAAMRKLEDDKATARKNLIRDAGLPPPQEAATPSATGKTTVMGQEINYTVSKE